MARKLPSYEKLTIEKLKSYPGLQSLTDEQAKEIVLSLEKLATLLFEMAKNSKSNEK
jgi:hypothetical protein